MASMLGYVLVAVVASAAAADENKLCTDVKVMENLKFDKLNGEWWMWEYYGMIHKMVKSTKCHVSKFYPGPDGKSYVSLNDFIEFRKDKFVHERYTWNITNEDPVTNANLTAKMYIHFVGVTSLPFKIISTDYDKYMLVFLCQDSTAWIKKFVASLLLTRKKSWSAADLKEIDADVSAAMTKSGLKRTDLMLSNHMGCEQVTFPNTIDFGEMVLPNFSPGPPPPRRRSQMKKGGMM